MRRGPKPQSPEVKAQKRAVRSQQRAKPEHLPAAESLPASVTAPAWLKGPGLAIWKRLTLRLIRAKLIADTDRETFARYCRNFARWLDMQGALDKGSETYTVETQSGIVHRPRPEFMIADRLERMLLATEDRFGLNPAERQRIYAARAAAPGLGDLFDAERKKDDPATTAAAPSESIDSPIGMLN